MTRPARPSSASTSRRMVPLPMPPKDGLQEQTPRLSSFGVTRAVRAPDRAAAAQASAPAWPPPMTTTSKGLSVLSRSSAIGHHTKWSRYACSNETNEPRVLGDGGKGPPRAWRFHDMIICWPHKQPMRPTQASRLPCLSHTRREVWIVGRRRKKSRDVFSRKSITSCLSIRLMGKLWSTTSIAGRGAGTRLGRLVASLSQYQPHIN